MWLLFHNFFKQVQYIANISRTIKIPENKRLTFDADYLFAGGEKGRELQKFFVSNYLDKIFAYLTQICKTR